MALARCARCEQTYCLADAENTTCNYHPGKFRRWWSCCREMSGNAQGCRTGIHKEDVHASEMLDAIAEKLAKQKEATSPTGEVIIFEGPEGSLNLARQQSFTAFPVPVDVENSERDRPPPNQLDGAPTGDGGDALETVCSHLVSNPRVHVPSHSFHHAQPPRRSMLSILLRQSR
eukprot:2512215-Pleurochrysis_carterae.AAC.2